MRETDRRKDWLTCTDTDKVTKWRRDGETDSGRQTSKQARRQASRQAGRRKLERKDRATDAATVTGQTKWLRGRQTDTQVDRKREVASHTCKQTSTQIDMQVGWYSVRQLFCHTSTQSDGYSVRQSLRLSITHSVSRSDTHTDSMQTVRMPAWPTKNLTERPTD